MSNRFPTTRARAWACGRVFAAVLLGCLIPSAAPAADRTWLNVATGTFQTAGNWGSGSIAGAADRAIFDASASTAAYTVNFSGSVVNDRISVSDNTTFALNNNNYLLNNASAVRIGDDGVDDGTLTLSGGTMSIGSGGVAMTVGAVSGSAGTLIVQNTATLLFPGSLLAVGIGDAGTLSVSGFLSGGVLQVGSSHPAVMTMFSSGSVNVTTGVIVNSVGGATLTMFNGDLSAASLLIGDQSNAVGTMRLTGGGAASFSGAVTLGRFNATGNLQLDSGTLKAGSTLVAGGSDIGTGDGTISIDGRVTSAHYINAGEFTVGSGFSNVPFGGNGTLIMDGSLARLDTGSLTVAEFNSTGFVSVSNGAIFAATGAMTIGELGAARMQVLTGGDVLVSGTGAIVLANSPNTTGELTIRDAGSAFVGNSNPIRIGDGGNGVVNVLNGGLLSTSAGTIGSASGGVGTVIVSGTGSSWVSSSSIIVGGSTNATALLEVGPGALVSTGSLSALQINTGGTVHVDGATLRTTQISLAASGAALNFDSGTFNITGGGGFLQNSLSPLGNALILDATKSLVVNSQLSIGSTGIVSVRGGRLVGNPILVSPNGQLLIEDPSSFVSGNVNVAGGKLFGDGTVFGDLNVSSGGEVRLSAGERLQFSGNGTNSAQINLFGGELEIGGTMSNTTTGRISGRGVLRAGAFNNSATIALSAGISDVFGLLTNQSGGKTIITGGATSTFWDNVTNNAGSELRVSTGSTAVFLGNVTGLAQFTGPGTKIFEAAASLGPVGSGVGDTVVGAGGTVVTDSFNEDDLTIYGHATVSLNGGNSGVSRVHTLSIVGGTLDLTNNDLIVDYTGATPASDVRQMLIDGRLTTSAATLGIRLGYGESGAVGASSFGGQGIDDTCVLVKYTYFGDTDLDGDVDIADLGNLATNWQASALWTGGDFDYSGAVDVNDLGLLATNWQAGVGSPLAPAAASGALGDALASLGLPNVAVPEPVSSSLAALAGSLLTRRRRTSQKRFRAKRD